MGPRVVGLLVLGACSASPGTAAPDASTSSSGAVSDGMSTSVAAESTTVVADETTDGAAESTTVAADVSTTASDDQADSTSTTGDLRPDPLDPAVPYLERWLSEVDALTIASLEPNPLVHASDLASYYAMARTNVLLANRSVRLLDDGEQDALLTDVVELGDFLVATEMSNNACAQAVRSDFAGYFPPVPVFGWGFVGNYVEGDQVATYAPTYPECVLAEPLIVGLVSGDANPPLIRFGYNDGHAVWGLVRIARTLQAYGREPARVTEFVGVAERVLDDWLDEHAGTPHGLPGMFYEEFHDGIDYAGYPHQRLYWAVNSNAALGRAMIELAEHGTSPRRDEYWAMAQQVATVWKNETTSLNADAYAWLYSRSERAQDEYVEDTVHAGVTIPFLAAAFAAEPSTGAFTIYGSDIDAVASALDIVVPPPHDRVRRWMDGHDGLNLEPADSRLVGEWAALAPALRHRDYAAAEAYLSVLDTVTSQGDTRWSHPGYDYYRLLLDSYAIVALAQ